MTDRAAEKDDTALPARLEPWLVGALLLLFGAVVSAALPKISLAVQVAVTSTANSQAPTREASHKSSLRLATIVVRGTDPVFGGAGALPSASAPSTMAALGAAHPREIDLGALIREGVPFARAPPLSTA